MMGLFSAGALGCVRRRIWGTFPGSYGNTGPWLASLKSFKRSPFPVPLPILPHSRLFSYSSPRASPSAMIASGPSEFVGALDCGTTSVRFIVFDEFANIIAVEQHEFPQYYPNPGWHSHNASEIMAVSEQCIAGASKQLEDKGFDAKATIKAIGITNQRETTVAWSRKTGQPLCDAIVWTDSRNKGEVLMYENKLCDEGLELDDGTIVKGDDAIEALTKLTGLKLSTYFSAIKLHWMIHNLDNVRAAHEEDDLLFGTVDSWLVYNLTGGAQGNGIHIIDVTNASRTLLMDLNTLKWSPALIKFFGFRESVLPKIVSSSEVYGHIASGALEGIPIAGIVGDQQAALVGNKCLSQGEAKNTYGTGAFLLFNTGEEVVQSKNGLLSTVAYQAGPDSKPFYALEGSISVAGSAVKWLRDQMGMIKEASDINTLASQVENAGGVYFVTAFSGLLAPYWDTSAGALLIGLTQYTTPKHIARATLEAVSYHTRAVIEAMKADSGVSLKHLKVDGGMTNSDIVMQIQANIGGFDVVRPEMRESTALGSALLAGSAVRFSGWDVSKPETLEKVNTRGSRTFVPHMSEAERAKGWKRWQHAVQKAKGWEEVVSED